MNLPDEKREAILRLLDEHQPLPITETGLIHIGYGCPAPCCWGNEGGYDLDAHRRHLADELAPLLAGWLAEARGEGAVTEAEKFRGEWNHMFEVGRHHGLAEGEARVRARVEAVLREFSGEVYAGPGLLRFEAVDTRHLRAALDADAAETTGGGK